MNPVRKDVRMQIETCEFLNICTKKRSAVKERLTTVKKWLRLTWNPARKKLMLHSINDDFVNRSTTYKGNLATLNSTKRKTPTSATPSNKGARTAAEVQGYCVPALIDCEWLLYPGSNHTGGGWKNCWTYHEMGSRMAIDAEKLIKHPQPSICLIFSNAWPSTFRRGSAKATTTIATPDRGTLMYW